MTEDLECMLTSEGIMQPVQTEQEGINSVVKYWNLVNKESVLEFCDHFSQSKLTKELNLYKSN